MYFVLLFILCVYTQIKALPVSTEEKENISHDSASLDNSINKDILSGEMNIFKLPTNVENGLQITINGTIDNVAEKLIVVVEADSNDRSKDCYIIYDLKEELLNMVPESDLGIQEYHLHYKELPLFTLRILARISRGLHVLDVHFKAGGESEVLVGSCVIDNFKNIGNIVLKAGLHKINRLVFDYT